MTAQSWFLLKRILSMYTQDFSCLRFRNRNLLILNRNNDIALTNLGRILTNGMILQASLDPATSVVTIKSCNNAFEGSTPMGRMLIVEIGL